jgi:hypothetical protein
MCRGMVHRPDARLRMDIYSTVDGVVTPAQFRRVSRCSRSRTGIDLSGHLTLPQPRAYFHVYLSIYSFMRSLQTSRKDVTP